MLKDVLDIYFKAYLDATKFRNKLLKYKAKLDTLFYSTSIIGKGIVSIDIVASSNTIVDTIL